MAQLAIDRRVTLIAWEAMNHWSDKGDFVLHVFHKNNELAGYCSVLHAFSLLGISGDYGRPLSAAVISFGATARGALRGALGARRRRGVGAHPAPRRGRRRAASPRCGCCSSPRDPDAPEAHARARAAASRAAGRGPGRARHRRQLHPAGHRRAADVRHERGPRRASGPGRCSSTSPATRGWPSSGPARPRSPSRWSTSARACTTTRSTTARRTCGTRRRGRTARRCCPTCRS